MRKESSFIKSCKEVKVKATLAETSVCIVVVFNHRYDKNIDKLKKIYGNRFSRIVFLVPFYDGSDADVIPVYESSYQFQGYFIQAYEKLMATGCEYFLMIADDMVLNPKYGESDILFYLGMKNKKVGIDGISPLNGKGRFAWRHTRYSSRPFFHKSTEWRESLPSYDEAIDLFKEFWGGIPYPEVYEETFFAPISGESEETFSRAKRDFLEWNQGKADIPYPMAMAYSDILFVRRDIMKVLFHRMGIFAGMNLFVEIAIPTAIVLSVRREEVSFFSELSGRGGKIIWEKEEILKFSERCKNSYKNLIDIWDESWLYVHPVKLSSWEV